jgi:hypothetical protein
MAGEGIVTWCSTRVEGDPGASQMIAFMVFGDDMVVVVGTKRRIK